MKARLFEIGIFEDFNICSDFAYGGAAKLSSGIIHYNDIPVVQPLSCTGGFYAHCLKYAFDLKAFCPLQDRDYVDFIIASGLPTHNHLSWAFCLASTDEYLLSFFDYLHI